MLIYIHRYIIVMFHSCTTSYNFCSSYDSLCEVKFSVNNVEERMTVICMSNIFFYLDAKILYDTLNLRRNFHD